jgi:hypothetical protein
MDKVHRNLRLLGATGTIRVAQFRGTEHVVVPVTALVEGVVHPVNMDEPELVLASEFSIAPAGWNGRPVLPDHPIVNGQYSSAGDPTLLDQYMFGHIFNTRVENDQLLMEAWLDPIRAEAVGADAVSVVNRAREGKQIEISTGLLSVLEKKTGVHNRKRYTGIWRNITPDHLAMLPEGTKGACSAEMGCGANRANRGRVYLVTNRGLAEVEEETEMADDKLETGEKKPTMLERFFDAITFKGLKGTAAGKSDTELRSALNTALRAEEPGFMGVEQVFPEDSIVVFAAMPGDKWQLFRRGYSAKSDGTVKLADGKEAVIPVTNFVAASAAEEQQPGCGCAHPKKEQIMDKALRIKALIDGSKGRFTDVDKPWLEAVPEDRLKVLETEAPPVATPVANAAAPVKPEEPKPLTLDQYVAAAPAEIREALTAGVKANAEKRQAVIKALKDTKRCTFTDEQLAAMSLEQLEQLRALAGTAEPVTMDGVIVTNRVAPATGVDAPPSLINTIRADSARH